MTVILLPKPKDPKDDWKAEKPGFFQLKVEDVRNRLGLAEFLAPEGIASPLAQLHYFNWTLGNQESLRGKEAAEALRLVAVLQYLGHLEGESVSLTSARDLTWFGPLLEKSWGTGPKSLILWKIRALSDRRDGFVFAASFPENPFLPGATFYPDSAPKDFPAWRQVRDALVAIRGPKAKLPLVDAQGEVADPHLAASLCLYLDSFIGAGPPKGGWVRALMGWRDRLRDLARQGRPQPPAQAGFSLDVLGEAGKITTVSFGFYTGGSPREVWICPECEKEDKSWINFSGHPIVTSESLHIRCSQHRAHIQIENEKGELVNVGPEHYGAFKAPDGTLYVWIDEAARPVGAKRVGIQGSPGSQGAVVYRFNNQEIVIKGHLISLDTVRANSVAWIARREREEPVPVDVPVRGEYAILVESCEREDLNLCWMVKFHGLREAVEVRYPESRDTLWKDSTIVIWPPKECNGWSIDYVAASTPGVEQVAYRLIEAAEGGNLVPSALCFTGSLYRTKNGQIKYVEVGEVEPRERYKPMGLLKVERPRVLEGSEARGQIALDFGTSNSAVAWEIPGLERPSFVLSGEDPKDPACFPTFNKDEFKNLLIGVDILSPWNKEEKPRPFLPSMHAERTRGGSEPSIPPRGHGLDLLLNPGGRARVVDGLKWKDWKDPGTGDRIESFLEILLLPAFWELRAGGCMSAGFAATYPLAFEETRRKDYEDIVGGLVTLLSQKTGLRVDTKPLVAISESAAASSFLPQLNVTHVVALDCGGFTTDLALHVGNSGNIVMDKEPGTVLVADSIEYAGRDFLRAIAVSYGTAALYRALPKIAGDLHLPDPSGIEETEEALNAYVASLEALLHLRGVEGLNELLRHVPEDRTAAEINLRFNEVIFRWEALLACLLVYARRMVEGCVAEVPDDKAVSVSFNLLGQGWELLRILGGDIAKPVTSVLAPRFQAFCEEIGAARGAPVSAEVHALPEVQERKTAVAEGAVYIRKGRDPGALGGKLPAPTHAATANVRRTFVGMNLYDERGQLFVAGSTRLEGLSAKPRWPGDPGYGRLVDELFEAIPEVIPGFRSRVRSFLFDSNAYRARHRIENVRQHLIQLGQDDLNREKTWPKGNMNPARSLLAGFLTSVWKPIWSSTKL